MAPTLTALHLPHPTEITATWSGTLSIKHGGAPGGPQVSFNMSKASPPPPPALHVAIHLAAVGNIKTQHIPGGETLTATHAHELLCGADTTWCF